MGKREPNLLQHNIMRTASATYRELNCCCLCHPAHGFSKVFEQVVAQRHGDIVLRVARVIVLRRK